MGSTMKYYKIIQDQGILEDFIHNFLPDLGENEKFYMALFARKKYDSELNSTSSDKMQLKRLLCNKENLVHKIKQLEIPYGLYTLNNTVATQKSLAIYITPNPRCMKRAQNDLLIKLATAIAKGNVYNNVHSEAISSVQRSKANTIWVDFDIDTKDINIELLKNILLPECFKVLETRGGYHVLVNSKRATEINKQVQSRKLKGYEYKYPLNWYMEIKNLFEVDQSGDQLIPIPGCSQGGFIPKFVV
jgi:hypothetical protein